MTKYYPDEGPIQVSLTANQPLNTAFIRPLLQGEGGIEGGVVSPLDSHDSPWISLGYKSSLQQKGWKQQWKSPNKKNKKHLSKEVSEPTFFYTTFDDS